MCELFGASSREKVPVNALLREFYSHSREHPDGWGMAVFYENAVSLEKEPLPAYKSAYLKERLRHTLAVHSMIAHIRKATIGALEYKNCHPFVKRDNSGRSWTLAHNGTIFDCPALTPYVHTQEGSTDSERILCHLIAQVNTAQAAAGRAFDAGERFALIDRLVCKIAPHNKLNLLLYDSELLYVHTNYAHSFYKKQLEGTALFAHLLLPPSGGQYVIDQSGIPYPGFYCCERRSIWNGHRCGTSATGNSSGTAPATPGIGQYHPLWVDYLDFSGRFINPNRKKRKISYNIELTVR